jgi:hypothetical protein
MIPSEPNGELALKQAFLPDGGRCGWEIFSSVAQIKYDLEHFNLYNQHYLSTITR